MIIYKFFDIMNNCLIRSKISIKAIPLLLTIYKKSFLTILFFAQKLWL